MRLQRKINVLIFERPFVKRFALCYQTVVCWPDCKPEGPLFSAEFVSVCLPLTGTYTLQREPILTKLGHKDPSLI